MAIGASYEDDYAEMCAEIERLRAQRAEHETRIERLDYALAESDREVERLCALLDETVREREQYNGWHQVAVMEVDRLRDMLNVAGQQRTEGASAK